MIPPSEIYYIVDKKYGPCEIKEKGSRFIGLIFPISTREEAEKHILKLRKKYYDSTHVCFAYRLGEGKEEYFRYNDDGEPSGTAGLPIYNEIKSKEYLNVLAAVIRYYGGTKLGTGGLARAYGQSARKALDDTTRVTVYIKEKMYVSFPYEFTGEMMQVVNRYSIDILSREDRPEGVKMKLALSPSSIEKVSITLRDKSSGKISLNKNEK